MHEVLRATKERNVFLDDAGRRLVPPADWACVPPGDAALTRRVKLAGPSWAVIEKRGRKIFSRGVWASAATIVRIQKELEAERGTDSYAKKRASDVARRERAHETYVEDFEGAVVRYLSFSNEWALLARVMAKKVAAHATPVGSGTVARTQRIPVEERAKLAVIAWMRHQTTSYDAMRIKRVKGERRAVRRELAQISRSILDLHRRDVPHGIAECPLCRAIVVASQR
jgi:hypothetical protein